MGIQVKPLLSRAVIAMAVVVFFTTCKEEELPTLDCSGLKLDLGSKANVSNCDVQDGQINVIASGGVEPYTYQLNLITNTSGTFTDLKAGVYQITVTDANNQCTNKIEVSLVTEGSTFQATASGVASTECAPNSNGFLTVSAVDGVPPYTFSLNSGPFIAENVFTNLGPGQYVVEARDDQDCTIAINVEVPGMRYATIKSIIDLNCAISGCHNGDNGANRNWTVFDNVKENATNIRARTTARTMPPSGNLSQDQIDLIACWVNEGANN